jgi:hypothetical protein
MFLSEKFSLGIETMMYTKMTNGHSLAFHWFFQDVCQKKLVEVNC